MIDRKHYGIVAFPTSQAAAAAEAIVLDADRECRLIPLSEQAISNDGCYEVHFENRIKTVEEWHD